MTLRNTRRGITLLELLIVIAIVSMLAALTAGAVFKVKEGQEKRFTEVTLQKLGSRLDQHWTSVLQSAKQEYDGLPNQVKQELLTLADNTTAGAGTPKPHPRRDDRARLLYVKFRLKQEFPTSFSEAIDPCPVINSPTITGTANFLPAKTYKGSPTPVPPGFVVQSLDGLHAGKPAYIKFISDYMAANSITLARLDSVSLPSQPSKAYQAAIMLTVALEQPRGGLPSLPLEQAVGATFIRNAEQDADNPGMTLPRFLVDTWGFPLRFSIFPAMDPEGLSELATLDRDPQDPEGLLWPSAESKWSNPNFNDGLLHPRVKAKLVPTIISAGPDGKFGYYESNEMTRPNNRAAGKFGWLLRPIDLADLQAMGRVPMDRFDNIYSHRLRQTGARGD